MTTPKYSYLYVMQPNREDGYEFIIRVETKHKAKNILPYTRYWSRYSSGPWASQRYCKYLENSVWKYVAGSWKHHEQVWLSESELFTILL
jgi:hypothetical protein